MRRTTKNQDFGEIFLELKERTMELHNIVKKALNPSYLNTVHIQADQWLQDFQRTIDAWQYLKRGECKYDRKALKHLHSEELLNFDCISLWEWKQHRFTSNLDKVNNKYYLEPASLEEIVWKGKVWRTLVMLLEKVEVHLKRVSSEVSLEF
ncbi:hypothetical protein R3W88_023772 [Solanum pinnatisectum]|uniref:Uncharacterized protein n=1 Tax=Solanum pinnatisectum TaxID=50273 RepID=A0AAV9M0J4_9SOLN|nr:hypothetical protein R3W88_023772 [Solanum pinnatisectum]